MLHLLALLGALCWKPATALALIVTPPGTVGANGAADLFFFVNQFKIPLQLAFFGVATFFLFLNAATMVLYSHDESMMGQAKSGIIYAIFGGVAVAAAQYVAAAIAPGTAYFVKPGLIDPVVANVLNYALAGVSLALIVNIIIQAFRLLSSQGGQEYVDRARKRLIYSIVGAFLVTLVVPILNAATPLEGGGTGLGALINEGIGLANFLLTLVGAGAVLAIIIAGILLIISIDESLKEKAKALIKTSIVVIAVILISYALIAAFASYA